jgi:hypothetical protein
MSHVTHRIIVVVCICCLLSNQSTARHLEAQSVYQQDPAGCIPIAPKPPGPADLNAHANDPDTRPPDYNQPGERSLDSKEQLFQETISSSGTLGDFDWRVVDEAGTTGNFLPGKMLRSVGGTRASGDSMNRARMAR